MMLCVSVTIHHDCSTRFKTDRRASCGPHISCLHESLGRRGQLWCLPYAGIPQREAAAVRPDEDPVVRLPVIRRSLRAVVNAVLKPARR